PNDTEAELKFKQVNEANEVLSHPENRKKYDQYGKDWQHADQFEQARSSQQYARSRGSAGGGANYGHSDGDFSDFFESMFGGAGGRSRSSGNVKFRGQDLNASLQLDLMDVFATQKRTLTLNGKNIRITVPAGIENGQTIKIQDVATVQIGAADKIGDGSLNANPAVIQTIAKQPDVNTLDLTERLDEAIADLESTLPKSVEIKNQIFRQSDFIDASINNLNQTLLEGAFFVVIILFIFLMNWRTTLISLLAIPISLLVSIIVLKLLGYTINTMSLGGMAIAIGALVDDAIIDVENVYKRLRENVRKPKNEREPTLTVVRDASVEIRSSIIIATLIIIVSFIPLFFLSGMEGRLLQPLGIAF
ncbi:hypothetical protein LCGC14_3016730, partial [marine sediment metagenome]